ncbi:amidase [Williamsia sp. MIQD14]|uniref:amidase n=1 Tax=Williamsia sp. MIQD14 TaxID=3425703 RepID=UPI003DA08DEA
MRHDEYVEHDAVGLADLVARGEVTAAELLEAAIARADAVEPSLNSITVRQDDAARDRASGPLAGPLAGVPFLVKDLYQSQRGVVSNNGSRSCANAVAAEDDTVVTRWLDAGLVIFGRTNTPEFGAKGTTEPEAFGAAHNPWDLAHTPGGSSGGSAAAVAAGIVPAAGASDGGGSIRIPAACCGLFGLKPGRGVVPSGPGRSESLYGSAVDGVVTRTVRDSAAMLDVMRGTDPAAPPYVFAEPDATYLDAVSRAPKPLRIGVQRLSVLNNTPDPAVLDALSATCDLLTDLGHVVEEARPAIDEQQLADDFLLPWFVHVASAVDDLRADGAGTSDFELDTLVMAAIGRTTSGVELEAAHGRWHTHVRALGAFHQRYDLLMTPTVARTAPRLGDYATSSLERLAARTVLTARLGRFLDATGTVTAAILRNLSWVPYTQLANLTGRPAASIPLHQAANGLPIGIQFVAPPGGEGLLFSLAGQLEQALPWRDRRPAL